MPVIKISQLPPSDPLDGTELIPNVQSAETRKTTAQEIADLALPTQIITDAGKSLVADGLGGVSYQQITPYPYAVPLILSILLSHDGSTNQPTITYAAEYTFGGSATWTRQFLGQYSLSITNHSFVPSKMGLSATMYGSGVSGPIQFPALGCFTSTSVYLNTFDYLGNLVEFNGSVYIQIKQWP